MLFLFEFSRIAIFIIICLILVLVILGAAWALSLQQPDANKLTPYECGFDPYGDARNSIDVKFYLVGLLFLLFDLETIFFLPWTVSINFLTYKAYFAMCDFIFELFIGLLYAWSIGVLNFE